MLWHENEKAAVICPRWVSFWTVCSRASPAILADVLARWFLGLALVIGIASGVAAVLFGMGIAWIQTWAYGTPE